MQVHIMERDNYLVEWALPSRVHLCIYIYICVYICIYIHICKYILWKEIDRQIDKQIDGLGSRYATG